ncbi:MAG: DUF2271 domain-containing protein [Bacteroidota bacterium]
MRSRIIYVLLVIGIIGLSFKTIDHINEESTSYKCMVQLVNYDGEGAYIITSLVDPEGEYEKTLYVVGEDDEWYHLIDEWWTYFGREKRSLDGITGATVGGGERKIYTFEVENKYLDQGYKIRFETSVEDQKYHPVDLELALESELPSKPVKGSGYIRYVRMMPN